MTLKVGRASLTTPRDINTVRRNTIDEGALAHGLSNPALVANGSRGFIMNGLADGTDSQANMDAADLEAARLGAVYLVDDSAVPALPAGYYAIEDFNYDRPRGAPRRRVWRLQVTTVQLPLVVRQGESDNVAGADTADSTADEALKVVYTPTTSEVLVLDPRNVAGAEALNLPAGTYKVIARVYQVTNTSAKFRFTTTQTDGTTITAGAQVAIGAAGAWTDLDLGSFTISSTYAGANWYKLEVQGVAAELGDTWIDRLIIAPA